MKDLLLKNKGRFILYVIACFLPVISRISTQFIFAIMLDSIKSSLEKGDMNYFIKSTIISLSIVLLGSILFIISRFMRISYMRDTILEVRMNAFKNILKKTYKDFHKKSKEVYISNLVNDINIFEETFFINLINIIFSGGLYIVCIIILLFLDYKFAIGIVLMSVMVFFISKSFEKKTVNLKEKVSTSNEKFTVNVANTFNGIEILKLNTIEKKFLEKSLKAIDEVEINKFRYTVFTQTQRCITQFLSKVIYVGILVYILYLIFNGESLIKAIFMMQIANMCIWPIGQVVPLFNEFKASANIYNKITNDHKEDVKLLKQHTEFEFNSNISAKDLTFNYEGKEIFKHATFNIEKGKKYLLKGSSGSGKSTLIKLLSRIYDDYDGEIKIDDVDYKNIKEQSFNSNVSFIYQDVFLFEDTIFNNIALFKDLPEEKVLKAAERAGLSEFLKEKDLGLQDMLMENGKNLSGGQRQRISIARALVKDASILFVDEGTSNLNEELGSAIEDIFLSLDNTVISISHRYYQGVTEKYDYVIEIKDKKIKQYSSEEYFSQVVII